MHPIPSIAESVCPFMERALMGSISIHPEDEIVANYLVSNQRGESMMAAILRSVQKQQEIPSSPSKKTLILHNIPRDITVEELRPLFEKYGPIRDIYIPRNKDETSEHFGTVKGFAMIKYLSPDCAKKAYDAEFGRLYLGFRLVSVEYAKEDR